LKAGNFSARSLTADVSIPPIQLQAFFRIAMKQQLQLAAVTALWAFAAVLSAAEPDTQLAALELAAGRGDPKAQTELAVKYEHAEGVPKDFRKLTGSIAGRRSRAMPRRSSSLAGCMPMAGEWRAMTECPRCFSGWRRIKDMNTRRSCFPMCAIARTPKCRPACYRILPLWPRSNLQAEDSADAPGERSEIAQLVRRLAPQYAVDWKLALAVISSSRRSTLPPFRPKKAQGLMQLIPETAERFGVKKIFNPTENIKGGLSYLRWLLAFFEGDVQLVLAAYNAGRAGSRKIPWYSALS
jgi:hypothetical protein